MAAFLEGLEILAEVSPELFEVGGEAVGMDFLGGGVLEELVPELETLAPEIETLAPEIENISSNLLDVGQIEIPEIEELTEIASEDKVYSMEEIEEFLNEEFPEINDPIENVVDEPYEVLEENVESYADGLDEPLIQRSVNLYPEELEANEETIFDQLRNASGDIEERISSLRGQYNEAMNYIQNLVRSIRTTQVFKVAGVAITIDGVINTIKDISNLIKASKKTKDVIDKIIPDDKKDDKSSDYNTLNDGLKNLNTKEEIAAYLTENVDLYNSLSEEEKKELIETAKNQY